MSLGTYLLGLGFSATKVGVIIAGTLVGSAVLTIAIGWRGARFGFRTRLLGASVLMALTAFGFLSTEAFVPLLLVAVVGTMNPTAGDVSVFLPTEQAFLAGTVSDDQRIALYARYGLIGNLAGAVGALGTSVVEGKAVFVIYGVVAAATAAVYAGLPRDEPVALTNNKPLAHSRRVVFTLAALFSLDASGGGFVVTSLLVLWLHLRHGYSTATTGAIFFVLTLLAAVSQLAAPMLARRVGLVRTMVFTHIPANAFLVVAALVPYGWLAVGFLMARALLSQLDVAARQTLVMTVVHPEERAAAASITNVPRSLAGATTPALAGYLLTTKYLGAPLVIGGLVKAAYDVIFLFRFKDYRA